MRIGSVERTRGDVVMEWRGQALTSCEDSYYLTHSTFSRYDVFTEKCHAGQKQSPIPFQRTVTPRSDVQVHRAVPTQGEQYVV